MVWYDYRKSGICSKSANCMISNFPNLFLGKGCTYIPSAANISCRWHLHKLHMVSNVTSLSLSLSNGTTARGGPWPPSRVSSILPGLGWLLSSFYTLTLMHLPSLHLPNAVCVSLWGAFLLAHWGGLSWINHHHPGVWHVLPISIHSACRISQCHSHHTTDRVLG